MSRSHPSISDSAEAGLQVVKFSRQPRVATPSSAAALRNRRRTVTARRADLATRLRQSQRALRSRIERRDALLELMREASAPLDPTKIAELVVERLSEWLPVPCWAVIAVDPGGQLTPLTDRGVSTAVGPAIDQIAQWIIRSGEEFLSADLARDPRLPGAPSASLIGFALCSRGRTIGAALGLDSAPSTTTPRLSEGALLRLRQLLEAPATAIDNTLRIQRAEALSVTDDLTHLYNSRYLNQALRRESKRVSRSGRPLSLLFIDLDGFKSVNDQHGHLCGSRALVEAAEVIRGSARETDIVARFGGDEFAVVLPDTGSEGAIFVAERVRERLAAHPFLARDGLDIRLTASVGVATLPGAALSADELVKAADAAMYRVKDAGKNGIRVANAGPL